MTWWDVLALIGMAGCAVGIAGGELVLGIGVVTQASRTTHNRMKLTTQLTTR
jgi:hypothetical protein